jgi:hypothetical protein
MTTPTPNDFRELCAELLEKYDLEWRARERIKTFLSQPEPHGPTDDAELRTTYAIGAEARWREGFSEAWSLTDMERAAHTAGLRAVLARWGRSAIKPVPVSERLPGGGAEEG